MLDFFYEILYNYHGDVCDLYGYPRWNIMKKIIITGFVLLMTLTTVVATAIGSDWQSKYPWAVEAVNYCTGNAILQGDEYGDLMLGRGMTRAQMAKMISVTFGLKAKDEMPFTDVEKNNWEYPYIATISDYVVVDGNYYDPSGLAKREDYIVTIMKVLGAKPADTDILSEFSDVAKISSDCKGYVAAAVKEGIINGSNGNIKPRTSITRAEACVILYRAQAKKEGNVPADNNQTNVNAGTDVNGDEIGYTQNSYDTTIIGSPKITVEQAKAWAKDRGGSEKYINVADAYWYYGELMGIRPEILYAQAGWETNFGKYTGVVTEDMNNWAGIKVYGRNDDAKDAHETFATPEEGARGHFNHMSAYIGVEPVGEPHARYHSVKSLAWAGTVKTLEELGGKWCPDEEYGFKILTNCLIPMSNY